MTSHSINKALEKLASQVPGTYTYIFDASNNEFIYKSEENEILQGEVVKLNSERGLDTLVKEAENGLVSLECQTTGRIFMIKKMASEMFLGMCVENSPEKVKTAESILGSTFI